jgi:hypothetical protein
MPQARCRAYATRSLAGWQFRAPKQWSPWLHCSLTPRQRLSCEPLGHCTTSPRTRQPSASSAGAAAPEAIVQVTQSAAEQ